MFNVGDSVVVCKPISFQGGTSTHKNKIGVVKAARERSCDVLLEGETGVLWFFNRELTLLDSSDHATVEP